MGYGKVLWPINISGLNVQLYEDSGGGMTQMYSGTPAEAPFTLEYYVDKGQTASGFGNLLDRLETLFNANGNNTYEFQGVEETFGRADFRLKLVRTAGSDAFELRTTDSSGSILEILGAPDASDLEMDSGGGLFIEFTLPYQGSWLLARDWQYHDYRKYPQMQGGIVTTAADTVHIRTRNSADWRHFHFLGIPGVLAFEERSNYQDLVDLVPGTDFGMGNIAFETFWDECIRRGKRFRFYHDIDVTVLDQTGKGKSEMRVIDPDFIMNPFSAVTDRYKEFGDDYVDLQFDAKELSYTPPVAPSSPSPPAGIPDPGLTSGDPVHEYRFFELGLSDGADVTSVSDTGTDANADLSQSAGTSAPDFVAGVSEENSYVDFDGVDDWLRATSSHSKFNFFHDGSDWAIAAVIQPDSTDAALKSFISNVRLSSDNGIRSWFSAGGDSFRVDTYTATDPDDFYATAGTVNMDDDAFHTFVASYDDSATTLTLYVDGTLIATDTGYTYASDAGDAVTDMLVGARPAAGGDGTAELFLTGFLKYLATYSLHLDGTDATDFHTWATTNGLA